MRISFVGCGYVADYYFETLSCHPELELAGITDRDENRASHFANSHSARLYHSLGELLEDSTIDIVVNLTNPNSHYSVSKACLESGKHVYTEKPLAMNFSEAEELIRLAEQQDLYISSAPCSLLGETAQTLWRALRENVVGNVMLVYAEMDDGLIHSMPYQQWKSHSGAPWPYEDEFESGCVLEHAGYYVTWLVAYFGPATKVTAFSSCLIPEKIPGVALKSKGPDFSVACIEFSSGVVARLTCSIIANHNHSLKIFGDEGTLSTIDCWRYNSPVHITRRMSTSGKARRNLWTRCKNRFLKNRSGRFREERNTGQEEYPLLGNETPPFRYQGAQRMDFCRGVAELAQAVTEKRPCRLSPEFSLHVCEVVLAINDAIQNGSTYRISSSFDSIEPMPWAKL